MPELLRSVALWAVAILAALTAGVLGEHLLAGEDPQPVVDRTGVVATHGE